MVCIPIATFICRLNSSKVEFLAGSSNSIGQVFALGKELSIELTDILVGSVKPRGGIELSPVEKLSNLTIPSSSM